MLEITVPGLEDWDERTNEFVHTKPTVLRLEHSLLALSKWECKWHKPWLDPSKPKTQAELYDYIRCMTVTQGVDYINPAMKPVFDAIRDELWKEVTK